MEEMRYIKHTHMSIFCRKVLTLLGGLTSHSNTYVVPVLPLDGSVLFFLPYVFTSAIVGGNRF